MEKKHIITIAGNLGSGKSWTSSKVAEMLDYEKRSTGDFFRSIAKQKNITLEDLNKLAITDSSIDKMVDDSTIKLSKGENIVIDSRLAFHFIPDSFKVFLACNPHVAAERIAKDMNTAHRLNEASGKYETIEEISASISKRAQDEKKRYFEKYNVLDITDSKHFDFIVDTSLPENNKEKVPELITEAYKRWLA
jgi:cytidylate kinase